MVKDPNLVCQKFRILDVGPEPLEQLVDAQRRQRILDVVPARGEPEDQVEAEVVDLGVEKSILITRTAHSSTKSVQTLK